MNQNQQEILAEDTQIQEQPTWNHEKGVWHGDRALQNIEIPDPLWIFGYGSLCYKNTEMDYDEVVDCQLNGYIRRFWQKTYDHRGTIENPGLVCTIVSEDEIQQLKENGEYSEQEDQLCKDEKGNYIGHYVWGKAFKIKKESVHEVLDKLDFREKGGYSRDIVELIHRGPNNQKQTIKAVLYRGNVENPAFLECQEKRKNLHQQAETIATAQGASGHNLEYFMKLYYYLQEQDQLDEYMELLKQEVDQKLSRNKKQ
ncbi:hypothetical protein PPERSA_11727 [Pseudocohnilembus persalinus]|uniref:glutathione-specific gamma-glutamylcyclotransferase n=1 Tax=Pseudocohnilembus persalinus TaxID=266149 RepID=A0A0V0QGP1_PSEPJ|nr:hypothetical protein PPERSA_11727 [Pseudocohnilembus persalinus]|eukprot:KRX01280.1 hypothetical protein PPERSA_11727 [Pseudocohnilembus persalinus]